MKTFSVFFFITSRWYFEKHQPQKNSWLLTFSSPLNLVSISLYLSSLSCPSYEKNIIGQIQLYGNLPYKCSIQKKRQIQLVVRDRMNSICPMNFFRTTDKTDTTDTTIWKPGYRMNSICPMNFFARQTRQIRQIQRYGNQALRKRHVTDIPDHYWHPRPLSELANHWWRNIWPLQEVPGIVAA